MLIRSVVLAVFAGMTLVGHANANEHGPVFGLATPTNGKGGWALDISAMGRDGTSGTASMSRAMLTYGITEDVQFSLSVPYIFTSTSLPPARITAMMSISPDFEGIGAWRFQRREPSVGTRFETTAYAGLLVPGPQRLPGMLGSLRRAPGVYTAIATGMASRSHYLWGGVGNTHYAANNGDQRPNLFTYSLVYAYRPPSGRKDYPHTDWRIFAEMTGEKFSSIRKGGLIMPGTSGHQIFLGPTALVIMKNIGIEGGMQFPVFRDVDAAFQRERFRYAVNLSYFF
jgi:hypothetical protein